MRKILVRVRLLYRLFGILVAGVLLTTLLSGSVEAAANWKYTALGDSLAFGLWAFKGYVPRYQGYIQADKPVQVTLTNLGVPGWTSGQLLAALSTSTLFRFEVATSRVVTWDIGGNDFLNARDSYKAKTCGGTDNQDCIRAAVATFKANWNSITAATLSLRNPSNTIIRSMNLYNPYVNADKAANTWPDNLEAAPSQGNDFQVFKPYVDDINGFVLSSSICSTAGKCADVYHKFNGPNGDIDPRTFGYISFDGLHPNDLGHRAIADLLRGLGYAPLK